MKIKSVFAILILLNLSACIEVRDNNAGPDEVQVQPRSASVGDLYVDGPLFLYHGQVLTEAEYQMILERDFRSDEKESYEYNFNELRFSPEGTLYTLGKTTYLNIAHLNSAMGKIETFPLNSIARPQTPGLSGGHIVLKVSNAVGFLTIVLRGENGGKGKEGSAPTELLRGKNGHARGGGCALGPSRSDGFVGLRGFKGQKGEAGGASGVLEFEVYNSTELVVNIQKEPGRGGLGGDGGAGGPGGHRGIGACRGEQGPQGPQGPRGENGDDGVEQVSCVKKNDQVLCI